MLCRDDSEEDDDDDDNEQNDESSLEDIPVVALEADSASDDEDDDYQENKKPKRSTPAKSPTSPKQSGSASKRQPPKRNIQVKIAKSSLGPTRNKGVPPPNRRGGSQSALLALAKKVLDETETPDNSLVAALLHSYKPIPGFPIVKRSNDVSSIYTLQLESIARKYCKDNDANALHVHLLNLLFRSVGGSVETNLHTTIDLEELEDQEWDILVSEVVQVMGETDADRTLFFADSAGQGASSKMASLGVQEYRKIYDEFWYRLGRVILSGVNNSNSSGLTDEDDMTEEDTNKFSSSRFDVEIVRDIVTRITELVPVGQPDLRAGATMAVLQLARACLERTVELEQKIQVAERQYNAAAKSNMVRKLQAVQLNMEAWKRHKAELEELVEGPVMQGVFMHRYRDSNPHIRAYCLQALSSMTMDRPDLFLTDKYLKYFGWMCSDKVASVRLTSLVALLAPFTAAERNSGKLKNRSSSLDLDVSSMQNVCMKFLNRIVDCTQDSQSLEVQEVALALLVQMLKADFLDDPDVMDENAWDQVNLKALDPQTSPQVRKDALYFILEQLDAFAVTDEASTSRESIAEKKQVERLEAIARW